MQDEKFYKHIFKNQITYLCEKVDFVRSATIGVWIRGGSIYEEKKNQGISHFIEHILFKGTKTRSARDISATIEGVGGELNAWTGKEYTVFYVKLPSEHLEIAIELLSDIIYNSLFSQSDIEMEKQVILEEIRRYEDAPDDEVHDLLLECAFGNHPLGRPILGKKEIVSAMDRKEIMNFYKTHYIPRETTISIAGNIDKKEGERLVFNYFSKNSGCEFKKTIPPPTILGRTINKEKDTEQVHFCMGTKGLPVADSERFVIALLNTILGGGMSSRLFHEIREKKGLCYAIYSYPSPFRDCGLLTVYCGCGPENYHKTAELILHEFKKMKNDLVDEKELKKAKEQLKGGLIMSLENTASRMERLFRQEAYFGRFFTTDEIMEQIEAPTPKNICDMANKIFSSDYISSAIIGPISKDSIFDEYIC
ncbi:TPA: peptidase M16 [bacterium]|nr:peptidase M16 [bacterium]